MSAIKRTTESQGKGPLNSKKSKVDDLEPASTGKSKARNVSSSANGATRSSTRTTIANGADKTSTVAKAARVPRVIAKDTSTNEDNLLRRSTRVGKGEGGVLPRLANLSKVIGKQPREPKQHVKGIPPSQPVNPMAPITKAKRKRKQVATEEQQPIPDLPFESAIPRYLVPPGTEPQLPGAAVHQFGFHPSTSSLFAAAPARSAFKQIRSSNIDPSLRDEHEAADHAIDLDDEDDIIDIDMAGDADEGEEEEEDQDQGEGVEEGQDESGVEDLMSDNDDDLAIEMTFFLTRYGPPRKSPKGITIKPTCYQDSRVSDMLKAGSKTDGSDEFLLELLRNIHHDWCREHRNDGFEQNANESDEKFEMANDTYDVLADHQRKNPPSKVRSFANNTPVNTRSPSPSANDSESDSADTPRAQRAPRNSKTPNIDKYDDPKQMQFYPPTIQEVLVAAKMYWRLWLVMQWAFPKFKNCKDDLATCLTQALASFESDNGVVDPGFFTKHQSDMVKLLWEDSSSFRGELKRLTRQQLALLYNFLPKQPEPDSDQPLITADEQKAHIKAAIAALLHKGAFMHNGKDSKGKTNNLTHPAIGEICRLFFYGSSNRLGHEFPDEFEKEIPEMALVLVITAIKCALDEWKEGVWKPISFARDVYKSAYQEVATLVEKVNTNKYHASKLLQARRSWAMNSMQVEPRPGAEKSGFEVYLD